MFAIELKYDQCIIEQLLVGRTNQTNSTVIKNKRISFFGVANFDAY